MGYFPVRKADKRHWPGYLTITRTLLACNNCNIFFPLLLYKKKYKTGISSSKEKPEVCVNTVILQLISWQTTVEKNEACNLTLQS